MEDMTVVRAFRDGDKFVRPGAVISAGKVRADDLERLGLVVRLIAIPENADEKGSKPKGASSKKEPAPNNKKAPEPSNKKASEIENKQSAVSAVTTVEAGLALSEASAESVPEPESKKKEDLAGMRGAVTAPTDEPLD